MPPDLDQPIMPKWLPYSGKKWLPSPPLSDIQFTEPTDFRIGRRKLNKHLLWSLILIPSASLVITVANILTMALWLLQKTQSTSREGELDWEATGFQNVLKYMRGHHVFPLLQQICHVFPLTILNLLGGYRVFKQQVIMFQKLSGHATKLAFRFACYIVTGTVMVTCFSDVFLQFPALGVSIVVEGFATFFLFHVRSLTYIQGHSTRTTINPGLPNDCNVDVDEIDDIDIGGGNFNNVLL